MNRYKKIICILLTILFAVNLSACASDALPEGSSLSERIEKFVLLELMDYDPDYVEYMYAPASFVVFFEEEDADGIYIPISEINAYESQYPDCSGTWYRDQLSGEELTIYNAYLYAMEHCYRGFSLYVEDNKKDFWYIRDLLALDSPLLEQNYNEDGEFTRTWDADDYGQRIYFHIEQFGEDVWAQKMNALDACRTVVAEIPDECDTQEEKMLYLYHYVCDQITYTEYDASAQPNYLHDAVCLGKTNCDGYSNMLVLLYNLLGVDTCEISGYDEEEKDDDSEGHTWVIAKLGDDYYHFDPTYEDTIYAIQDERTLYFGVSDALASAVIIDHDTYVPVCSDASRDFAFADQIMEDITSHDELQTLAKRTDQCAKEDDFILYVLAGDVVDDDAVDRMLDRYIDKVTRVSSISIRYIEVYGRTLLRIETEPW